MSNQNRHQRRDPNPHPIERRPDPNPSPLVHGMCWWRGPGGWHHVDITLTEAQARAAATKVHEPDALGMVLARVEHAVERSAQ